MEVEPNHINDVHLIAEMPKSSNPVEIGTRNFWRDKEIEAIIGGSVYSKFVDFSSSAAFNFTDASEATPSRVGWCGKCVRVAGKLDGYAAQVGPSSSEVVMESDVSYQPTRLERRGM